MKKTILIIHHHGSIGGAGTSLLHIVRAIDKSKYNVVVLCPEKPSEIIQLLEAEDCKVIRSKKSPKIFAHYNGGISYAISLRTCKNIHDILKDKKQIEQYIKEVNPDIVAVNSMTLFWIGKLAKKMKLKTICFHRETYQKGLFGFRTRIIKRGLSRWFDKIAFISNYDLEVTGKTKAKKYLIYDRVDFSTYKGYSTEVARARLGLSKNDKYILYLGGFSSLKGAEVIIDAMKYISDKNIKLIFVGDIESIDDLTINKPENIRNILMSMLGLNIKKNINRKIEKNNLRGRIIFKKRNNCPEVFYNSCDLIVFPSTLAHQSRPIYEAGITRIPILITDFQETNEFAKNGVTAVTFKNKDSYDLADKISKILGNKIDMQQIIDNNYKQTIANHNLDTLKSDLEQLFQFD